MSHGSFVIAKDFSQTSIPTITQNLYEYNITRFNLNIFDLVYVLCMYFTNQCTIFFD